MSTEGKQKLRKQSDRPPDSIDSLHTYFREIARVPLLTREQEIDYWRQVQKMMPLLKAKEDLVQFLRRQPTSSEWAKHIQISEAELSKTLRQGQRSQRKMVEANLRLFVAIAKKYQNRGLELLDLFQEGAIGLTRGVERFDPAFGYKFSTYAYWWIRQGITRALSQKSRTIRLPVHITEKANRIKKAQYKITQRTGRIATLSEIAIELGVDQDQVRKCLEWTRQLISLDLPIGDSLDTCLEEMLRDPDANPKEPLVQIDLVNSLDASLAELKPQYREVLSLRFGLRDGQVLTLADAGRRLNVCRERVRQIEVQAFNQLRQNVEAVAALQNHL